MRWPLVKSNLSSADSAYWLTDEQPNDPPGISAVDEMLLTSFRCLASATIILGGSVKPNAAGISYHTLYQSRTIPQFLKKLLGIGETFLSLAKVVQDTYSVDCSIDGITHVWGNKLSLALITKAIIPSYRRVTAAYRSCGGEGFA